MVGGGNGGRGGRGRRGGISHFLKGCNLAPRGFVNKLTVTVRGLLLSSTHPHRLLRANGRTHERKRPPLAEKLRGSAINSPTGRSELRINARDNRHNREQRAAAAPDHHNEPDRAWIITTMTLEEIRGQENAMEIPDR